MKIKKAILTGGGRATRLQPITTTINKHLLPLANKPMIFHAIEKAVAAGVTEIFINTNPGETELQQFIGDGGHWGITIKFFEQTGGPLGIAHVVNEAKDFIGDEPFMFFLSDNVLLGDLQPLMQEFEQGAFDCMLALSQVPDPERFGIPYFDEQGVLIDVKEKPSNPPNNLAVTGIYLYGPKVFFETFKKIKKSARGEYEISSIHSEFLKNKQKVGYKEITGWWKDTGKSEDLLIASQLLLDQIEESVIPEALKNSFELEGKVKIGNGTTVQENVKIIGPVIIGENCSLSDCVIGPHVTVAQGTSIKGAKITNTIILDNCTIEYRHEIVNSLIGKKVTLRERPERSASMIVGDKSIVEL